MKLHFAGAESALKYLNANNVSRLLITMASGERHFSKARTEMPHCDLMIDSGAFTFQTKGDMTLSAWIEMAHRVKPFGNELIALDVIGDPQKTWDNFQEIIKEHPDAIPTFHITAPKSYLKKYLDYTDRIAIGQMVPFAKKQNELRSKLAGVFSGFTRDSLPRFHAFGVCGNLLAEFPFYSADATSWLAAARFRSVCCFEKGRIFQLESMGKQNSKRTNLNLRTVDLSEISTGELYRRSIKAVLNFEKYLNDLWSKRGIVWNDSLQNSKELSTGTSP